MRCWLLALWNVFRRRPTMYRMRTGPFMLLADCKNARVLECFVDGKAKHGPLPSHFEQNVMRWDALDGGGDADS